MSRLIVPSLEARFSGGSFEHIAINDSALARLGAILSKSAASTATSSSSSTSTSPSQPAASKPECHGTAETEETDQDMPAICDLVSLSPPNWKDYPLHPSLSSDCHDSADALANWVFFIDLLNFSFWTSANCVPYSLEWQGQRHTGYATLCVLFKRAITLLDIPLHDPSFLASDRFDLNLWRSLCQGPDSGGVMPLLDVRFDILKSAGQVLVDHFDGRIGVLVNKCGGDIYKMIEMVVKYFPSFDDTYSYKNDEGKDVKMWFLKRAQILIADLWSCFDGVGFGYFFNIDEITMFADYRVPQTLQYFGILEYSKTLIDKLLHPTDFEMDHNSPYEIEIRAASILAVDRLLKKHMPQQQEQLNYQHKDKDLNSISLPKNNRWNAITVDYFLWDFAKMYPELMDHLPIHRTRCIYY